MIAIRVTLPANVRRLLPSLLLCAGFACKAPPERNADDAGSAKDAKADSSAPAEPVTPPAPACSAEALEPEIAGFCDFDLGVPPVALPSVDWTAEPYHPEATRVITLTGEGLLDPEGGSEAVTIDAWINDPPRRLPEPGVMIFAVAADVPVSTVAELQAKLAAAGRKEVRYLVYLGGDEPIPQPRKPKMLADMAAKLPSDPNEKIMFVAQGVRGYAQTCPAFAAAFKQLSTTSAEERCPALAKHAAAAIASCECEKVDEIMTLLYALTMGFDPPKGRAAAVPVMLDPTAEPHVAGEGETWGELAAKTFEDTQLHRLWIPAD